MTYLFPAVQVRVINRLRGDYFLDDFERRLIIRALAERLDCRG